MQLTTRPRGTMEAPVLPEPAKFPGKRSRYIRTLVLFLLPCAVLYGAIVLFPVVQALYYSLWNWSGLGPLTSFVGLKNFVTAISSSTFRTALGHNLIILVLSLCVQLPLALVLALVIGKSLPGRSIFRMIFFMPYILSDVVVGVIWLFIFEPNGLLSSVWQHVFPGSQSPLWMGDPNIVLYAIFMTMTWKYLGLSLVLYAAAIQNIPDELVEAARIDGASMFQVVRSITIPLMGSTIRLTILLSALGSLQYFDLIWIMTNGGPVHASETMATYLYKNGFVSFELGYGSAVGVIMFLICFVFAILYQRFVMSRDLAGSVTEAVV
ncbi:sugar ABC transporter permease [Ktedonobacter sp. SOSP1-85]|uniref:carbohydrate ABC transporter permease n=1 Tax=Ktedonobacter sp. SOSP1-85 TaxID=2778367 RepID=UPI001915693E|nr:sugar ABC transporter permease [Ktedonobacter sp. SOSP1-85]GHO76821.1 sugar ABC transporter permease [Ktedonobacter sp. SOSP1-85]